MVCQSRTALSAREDELGKVIETALVRSTYAGWCGGTAASAASYPISPGQIREAAQPGVEECGHTIPETMGFLVVVDGIEGLFSGI